MTLRSYSDKNLRMSAQTEMISLLKWSKREGVAYSYAQKLLNENKIIAIRDGSRIYVPVDVKLPPRATIPCQICGKDFPQITSSHLKLHKMTLAEYKAQFPNAPIVSSEISAVLSQIHIGKEKSLEQRAKISESKKGTMPWNTGLKGAQIHTEETRQKMSESHKGILHTEESKRKIGDAHRGKKLSQEQIDGMSQRMKEYYEEHPSMFFGKTHTDATKIVMSEKAVFREANYTEEQKKEIWKKRGDGNLGKKRTDEQKQRYRESRVKWMSENPLKTNNTAGEISIAEWLDKHNINYVRQFVIPGVYHPYDFYLPDHDTIIEFDGAHHWWRSWFKVLGKTKAEKDEMLRQQMIKDSEENMEAGRNGLRIIRICGVADVGDSPEWGSLEHQLAIQGFEMPE